MSDFDKYSGSGESEYRSGDSFSGEEEPKYKDSKGRKFGKSVISILTTVIIVLVGEVAGKQIGRGCAPKKEDAYIAEIEAFIRETEKYKPGVCTDKEYKSEHFGMVFSADKEWEMLPAEDLKSYSEQIKQSGISSAMAALKGKNVSQSLKNKLKESFYIENEMGAEYISDNEVVGEVAIAAMRVYGIDESTEKDLIKSLESELSQMGKVSRGSRTLNGKKYKTVMLDTTVEGLDIYLEQLLRLEDGVLCMINCRAIKGFEDEMMKSFEEHLTEY